MASSQVEELPQLGRYQVINKIAAGGMAEVFLAKAIGAMGFQRLVAVKLIHSNFTRDEEFVKMFIDEARIAMHLHHRNIVQVFDLDKVGETYFIAMEFVHGVNLYDLYERIASKNRWIDAPMALYLIAEVSKGLHFAHTRLGPNGQPLGIIHRDISPQNVLLSFEGEVKITDFGIATAAERLHQTAAGIVKGKYAYMAPERLQERPVDARVDVFSVGVLMYELLVGENPFAGTSAVDTIENVLSKEVPPPSERGAPVSTRLDEICLRALAKDPAKRYPNAQALADAVTEYAMELTHARKDMAAGDASVAALLAELFPERARRPLSESNGAVELPGIPHGVQVATLEVTPEDPATLRGNDSSDLLQTHEELPDQLLREVNARYDEDFDAPTVLRMSPMRDDSVKTPMVSARDEEARTAPGAQALEADSGYVTLPPIDKSTPADDSNDWALNSLATPSTPIDGTDGVDNTQPTELPLYESADKTLRSDQLRVDGAGPSTPARIDPYAQTTPRSSSTHDTFPDDDAPAHRDPAEAQFHATPPIQGPGGQHLPVSGSHHPMDSEIPLVMPVSQHDGTALAHQGLSTAPPAPTSSSRINVIAGVLLTVAAVVVVAAFWVIRDRPPPPPVSIPLSVYSQPPGAVVQINGTPQGNTAGQPGKPGFQGKLTPNQDYLIAVQLEGFEEVKWQIRPLEGSENVVREARLVPLTGALTITPDPIDARVYINGHDVGTGVVQAEDLPLNEPIRIQIERPKYKTYDKTHQLTREMRRQALAISLSKGYSPKLVPEPPSKRSVLLRSKTQNYLVVFDEAGKALGTIDSKSEDPKARTLTVELPVGRVKLRMVNEEANFSQEKEYEVPPGWNPAHVYSLDLP